MPLITGARLVLARPGGHLDSAYLVHLIAEQSVTALHFVPSMLAVFVEQPDLSSCSSVKRVFASGEALPFELQQRFFSRMDAELHNLYGPTEASIEVTFWACQRNSGLSSVPIGRPIANTRIYVLDHHLHPVPVGVPGELHIGGVGLARGYLDRPALTAEKFIPNPFGPDNGDRLYKTGDLATYLADGSLDFLGRLDDQVKLRGFRIELGEVEAAMKGHPSVRDAVVSIRGQKLDDRQLIAHFVPMDESAPATDELRRFLKKQLPDYMVPGAFIPMDALPRMPSGKVERRKLAAPDESRPKLKKEYVAPRSVVETQLTQIWEEILNVRPIGVTDDFYDLGGHSLLAVRVIARIKQRLHKDVPLPALLHQTTVEQLAAFMAEQPGPHRWSHLVEIQSRGAKQPIFLVHPLGGSVLCYFQLARHLDDDRPLFGLQAQGLDGEAEPLERIEEMASRYNEALRNAQPCGPYLLGGWSMGAIVAFEMGQQLLSKGEEVAMLALIDPPAPRYGDQLAGLDDPSLLSALAEEMYYLFGRSPEVTAQTFERLSPDEKLNFLLEWAEADKVAPGDEGPNQIERYLRVYKSNVRAVQSYFSRSYPGPADLFRAEQHFSDGHDDPTLGWQHLAGGGATVHLVPGNHFSMMRDPNVTALAEALKKRLDLI